MSKPKFELSGTDANIALQGAYNHIIACDGKAVIKNQSNGGATYLLYRTPLRAKDVLIEVKRDFPEAYIYSKEH